MSNLTMLFCMLAHAVFFDNLRYTRDARTHMLLRMFAHAVVLSATCHTSVDRLTAAHPTGPT